jgi:serine/threonine protein kinase
LLPGARVGNYVVDRVARDSYEVRHIVLPRRARLEVMQVASGSLREQATKMMRVACILEALRHPGVPQVFDVGVLPDQRPWVATELLDGVPLPVLNQPLPAADVITILRDIAAVLAYGHGRGIVHRNVVPDAIVFAGSSAYLTQWAEARVHHGSDAVRAFAADVHALGVIAQRLLGDHAPPRLTWLLEDMLVDSPLSRPIAAEVAARARLMSEELGRVDDEPIVEEQVVLVDIARPQQGRTRWTPPLGVANTPELSRCDGIAISVSKPRT